MYFDNMSKDSQATEVTPLSPDKFDMYLYSEYEKSLLSNCESFHNSSDSILVCRRVRPGNVFRDTCKNMKESLSYQLGALKKSMEYKTDIPNFLEPWYGIGTVASAFGVCYIWRKDQAPFFSPPFKSIQEALDHTEKPVKDTAIGRQILETIEYFLEQTKGLIPISLTDIQSPLNIACGLIDINFLFMEIIENPELFKRLMDKLTNLLIDFINEQLKLLKNVAVFPGHGFASARCFEGLGSSDDYSPMLSSKHFQELAIPALERLGKKFNGTAFHSCGNWGNLAETVKTIKGLKTVDGAFSILTDPSPNTPEDFSGIFKNSNIVVNARIVGNYDETLKIVRRLYQSPMKLIAVTYCKNPQEQKKLYNAIHSLHE